MDNKKIKDTLLLPKTDFSLRLFNHQEKEKGIRELWEKRQIYQKVLTKNQNGKPFILHSGPPYANGKIHLGHVLNFLIKDIIVRSRANEGFYTPFLLGWDTHGLPIEHKILQNYPDKKVNLRRACHEFCLRPSTTPKRTIEKIGAFYWLWKILSYSE